MNRVDMGAGHGLDRAMSNLMRRFGGAIALLAVLVLGLPAVALAAGQQTTYTIRQAGLLPVPDRGQAAPDFIVGNSPLFDRRNRRRVGVAPIVCTFPAPNGPPHCLSTLYLRRGSINLEGDLTQPTFTFQVSSGRGSYANATGTARGRILNPKEKDPLRALVRLTVTLHGVR
jgi:hypothetical protein